MSEGDGAAQLAWMLMVATVALVVLLAVWWVFAGVVLVGAVLSWLWRRRNDGPGESGQARKRRLAPLWHYPFVGTGSVGASLVGATAIHEIIRGVGPALPSLGVLLVLARSLSMAWFPAEPAEHSGFRVYPLVVITGPLSSGLGMMAVWVLVLGGQTIHHPDDHWLAMTSVPPAITIVQAATGIGRLGRTLVPASAPFRVSIEALLTPEAVDLCRERALWRKLQSGYPDALLREADLTESDGNSPCLHGDWLIPPIGPMEGAWAAFRPPIRLNWRRLVGLPAGAALGAAAGALLEVAYGAGPPMPQAVGALVAVWVWVGAVLGPLLCTFLYMDADWVGERGVWRRRGLARCDLGRIHRGRQAVVLEVRGSPPASSLLCGQQVRFKMRWSREELAALASGVGSASYGIWRRGDDRDRTWSDIGSDSMPLPHFREEQDIYAV
ncbi:MAG TPA: hypothetical protein VMW80_11320 [Candidatus Dormibacteraeota bacterium]|nr:hypothetical protein [Candidatus Dormibacteraeota bacterium]